MGDNSGIEWTDATWNPVVGCSIVSPGCTHCYAMGMAARIQRMTPGSHYAGTTVDSKTGPVWTGRLELAPEHILTAPLRWKRPRRIFVNSMGDLFHTNVPRRWIDQVFAVMALAPQHTFQVLTKRADAMRNYMIHPGTARRVHEIACDMAMRLDLNVILIAPGVDERRAPPGPRVYLGTWPLPNVWLGVSAERQEEADARIPQLLATPAAVRFVSAEPLLGPIDFRRLDLSIDTFQDCGGHPDPHWPPDSQDATWLDAIEGDFRAEARSPSGDRLGDIDPGLRISGEGRGLDLVIVGGESGPKARPMHPDWARDIRDQCADAGTTFFFKQWGEWAPGEACGDPPTRTEQTATWWDDEWSFGTQTPQESRDGHCDDEPDLYRIGKRRAGRLLDGRTHDDLPAPPAQRAAP